MGGALLFITDNGFIYQTGLPGWAIALIILGSILLSTPSRRPPS